MSDLLDPEAFVQCPYDSNHQMRNKRIQIHLINCRKSNPGKAKQMAKCPFNAKHIVPRFELAFHQMSCPDRAYVDRHILHETEKHMHCTMAPIINHNIQSDENWDEDDYEMDLSTTVSTSGRSEINDGCQLPQYTRHQSAAPGGFLSTRTFLPFAGGGRDGSGDLCIGRGAVGIVGRGQDIGRRRGCDDDLTSVPRSQPTELQTVQGPVGVSQVLSLSGVGRGGQGFPRAVTNMSTSSVAFGVSAVTGRSSAESPKFSHENFTSEDIQDNSRRQSQNGESDDVNQDRKKERKLRKKLKEILRLEQDLAAGKQLNEDQLKKISAHCEVDEQLSKLCKN